MLTGVYAARNAVGANYDIWSVNVEKEYHEEGKVEDRAVKTGTGDRLTPSRVAPEAHAKDMSPDEILEIAFARLDPVSLGAALGIVSGLGLFGATFALILKGGPMVGETLNLLGNYLPGFAVTWGGAFKGLIAAGITSFFVIDLLPKISSLPS
jgi:hypothetical protein